MVILILCELIKYVFYGSVLQGLRIPHVEFEYFFLMLNASGHRFQEAGFLYWFVLTHGRILTFPGAPCKAKMKQDAKRRSVRHPMGQGAASSWSWKNEV